jgi:RimJ/RimL family protein N-acetyltransferase
VPGVRVDLSIDRDRASLPRWWRPLGWAPWEVELRPVTSADQMRIAGAATDEIARSAGLESADAMRSGAPAWAASARAFALRGEAFRYLIFRSGRFAGSIEIRSDVVRGHVGYWLRRAERGQGTATRAAWMMVVVGFEGLGLRAVDFAAEAENASSIAVMERIGASLVSRTAPSARRSGEVRYRIRRSAFRERLEAPRTIEDLATRVR